MTIPGVFVQGDGGRIRPSCALPSTADLERTVRLALASELATLATALGADAPRVLAACGLGRGADDDVPVLVGAVQAVAQIAPLADVPIPTLSALAAETSIEQALKTIELAQTSEPQDY